MKKIVVLSLMIGFLSFSTLFAQEEIFVPKAWETVMEKTNNRAYFDPTTVSPIVDDLGNTYFPLAFSDNLEVPNYSNSTWYKTDKNGKIIWQKEVNANLLVGCLDKQNNFYFLDFDSPNQYFISQYGSDGKLKKNISFKVNNMKEEFINMVIYKDKILLIQKETISSVKSVGTITSINVSDGSINWKTTFNTTVFSFKLCTDNTITILNYIFDTKIFGENRSMDIILNKFDLERGTLSLNKKIVTVPNLLMSEAFPSGLVAEDGTFFIFYPPAGYDLLNFVKYSVTGEHLWTKQMRGVLSVGRLQSIDEKGNVYLFTTGASLSGAFAGRFLPISSSNRAWCLKFNSEGKWLSYINIESSIFTSNEKNFFYDVIRDPVWTPVKLRIPTPLTLKNDYLYWVHILHNPNKSFKVFLNKSLFPISSSMEHMVHGKIYADQNQNCQMENGERRLENFVIKINPLNGYTFSDQEGNFRVALPKGKYDLEIIAPEKVKHLVEKSCVVNVNFISAYETKEVNLGVKAKNISVLDVQIVSNRRRRCFTNQTTITYENKGFVDAKDVQIKVLFPTFVKPVRSNLAWKSKQDSVLIYEIPFISAGDRKSFVITDSVVCGLESIRGLTQCTKVTISSKTTPNQPPISPQWNKAEIMLQGYCLNKENVRFMIQNQGEGNMTDSLEYKVYFNNKVARIGRFKLEAGKDVFFDIARKDRTVRFEVDQIPFHPKPEKLSKTIEICSDIFTIKAPTANIMAGYPTQMPPENEGKETIPEVTAVSCLPIRDSYDPNDKQVFPQGVENKYITDKDELTYLVRFQNTGSDTAYRVVVEDTIDTKNLDMSTFQIAGASHSYEREIISSENLTIVKFIFNTINLPHQKVDDRGSNGFIQFKIKQKTGNPKGTVIRNRAYIYFDFNSAIITNQTQSTVWDLPLYEVSAAAARNPHPDIKIGCLKIESIKTNEQTFRLCEDKLILPNPSISGTWKNTNSAISISQNTTQTTLSNLPAGTSSLEWIEKKTCQEITTPYKINVILLPEVKISQDNLFLVANSQNMDSYQWFLDGVKIEGATQVRYQPEKTGVYTVLVTKNNCQKISPAFRLDVLDNENPQLADYLQVYVAENHLHVRLDFVQTGQVQMQVINAEGKTVWEEKMEKNTTKMEHRIDIQALPKGMYLLFLQSPQGQTVKKLVKE